MRVLLIVLDLVGALAVMATGEVMIRVHDVHSYSTFVELRNSGMLADQLYANDASRGRVTEEPPKKVLTLLQAIGSVKVHVRLITLFAAGLLLINGVYLCLATRSRRADRGSAEVHTPSD